MRHPVLWILLALTGSVILAPGQATAEPLQWGGCSLVQSAVVDPLVDPYRGKTGVPLQVRKGGPAFGPRGTARGDLDLGGACHPALANGPDLDVELVHVAWEALVPIVHPSNPVEELSLAELRRIFRGEITNWKEVGGDDRFIVVGHRARASSGPGQAFRELAFEETLDLQELPSGLARKSTRELESAVANLDNAIAVTGMANARHQEVKVLRLEGTEADAEAVAEGQYPLYLPLYLVLPTGPEAEVEDFVDFALSDQGQKLLKDHGTVTLSMGENLDRPWEEGEPPAGE